MYFDIEVSTISKQSYIECYFDIEAQIHIQISKFCTLISKFVLRYRRSISKLSLILSDPAHAGLLKAIAGCCSVVYSHGSVFNCNSELDADHKKADIYGGVTPAAARGGPAAGVAGVVVAELCAASSPAAAAASAAGGAAISRSMLYFIFFGGAP